MKIFNRRVKGSEKFWSEAGAEAILQLRAAFLSEDGRLDRHLKERPSGPFRTNRLIAYSYNPYRQIFLRSQIIFGNPTCFPIL